MKKEKAINLFWKWEKRWYNGGWLWFSKSKCRKKADFYFMLTQTLN